MHFVLEKELCQSCSMCSVFKYFSFHLEMAIAQVQSCLFYELHNISVNTDVELNTQQSFQTEAALSLYHAD